ncbi:MAG: tRNA (N(6)-L-threonylcarbamoyladenosine(37)-C(2))-methylthiotransferase MtaB [Proteobacteria bacterium]|nr:tRNA (N(6)-L-threonylcarbamoyladenosine(37)-C(2))-methylthiotransferase MtaB [Pseudomonadota bacterium]MBU1454876.1 tRNA (N(6)-L-threonylcarbamoyladenosine(37)-C(2))-methylthiotransferase MtaB [Pseudomonadota bacterium]
MKKKVIINTLGCKVNQYESASFLCSFEEAGCRVAEKGEDADIIVINTCAVTAKAGAQSRQTVRRLIRRHPQAKIVITGCYAQMAANELAAMVESPVCIVGNGNKHLLVETALKESPCDLTMLMGRILKKKEICPLPMRRFGNRTRAYLRVQDGCNNFCTYCIVPYTRGPSRSLELSEVLSQAKRFAQAGHREIVLTGIHVGMYGRDLDKQCDIADLVFTLCHAHPDIRFRLSSIEPQEISDRLLQTMSSCQNFMPHFHIPLQSGDDTILSRMNRGYDRETFRRVVEKCRSTFPDAAIGIDILTGFPGEGVEEFANSKALLKELDATYFHVFPYSSRPGTPAATFKNQVPKAVREERVAELRTLAEEKKSAFYKRYLGTQRPVLVEHKRNREGMLSGFTDNYIPVAFPGTDSLMGKIVPVLLELLEGTTVVGRGI